jgi:superoxide dismutase
LSTRLLESHYENNYGGALRRLNAITEKLESLDFAKTPGYVINGLKREEVIAFNSTLLHELYFASLGVAPVAKGRNIPRPAGALAEALTRDFRSFERWRDEFVAMGNALAGGAGWVLLVYVPRSGRLINQYASEHTPALVGGIPVLAHPVQLKKENFAQLTSAIKDLADMGLGGVEVIHSDHRESLIHELAELAERFGLLQTGGSDFHGANKPHIKLGFAGTRRIPRECYAHLIERLHARV